MSKIEVCQEYIANFGILYESEVCKKGIKGQKKYQEFDSTFLDRKASINVNFIFLDDTYTNSPVVFNRSTILYNFPLRFTREFFSKEFKPKSITFEIHENSNFELL